MPNNEISVSVFGCTDVGRQRLENEDAFLVTDLTVDADSKTNAGENHLGHGGILLAVADGMGGEAAGEIASGMAIVILHELLALTPVEGDFGERLRQATECANDCIWERAQEDPILQGMGSTLTAALVKDGVAYLSQVGDSRAYLIRDHYIRQLTRDQSLVQFLVDLGEITPEEAVHHPQKNVIMQALGALPRVKVGLTTVELCRDDFLIMCSDGLSNLVEPHEMRDLVVNSPDRETACRRLIELANDRGGDDNITVIVARFHGEQLRSSNGEAVTAGLDLNLE